MGVVEHVRWWQWIIISLLIGAALGYINQQGKEPPSTHRSMEPMQFEGDLRRIINPPGGKPVSYINDVIIYPPHPDLKRGGMVQMATFVDIVPDGKGQVMADDFYMLAPYPYEVCPHNEAQNGQSYPGATIYTAKRGDTLQSVISKFYGKFTPLGRAVVISANNSFREAHSNDERQIQSGASYFIPWNPTSMNGLEDFMDAANKMWRPKNPVSYRYVWWQSPQYAYRIWIGASFLAIGVIWPALLRMMLVGGLGRQTAEEYDLNRFKPAPVEAKPVKPAAALTIDDLHQIEMMQQQLAASTEGLAITQAGAVAANAGATAGATAVKTLVSDSTPKEAPKTEEEQAKEFRGEFYPVAKTVVKGDKGEKKDKKV